MSFFQNTCKPKGLGGSLMVNMMNIGHSPMAEWGLKHIKIIKQRYIIRRWLRWWCKYKKTIRKKSKG